MRKQDLCLLYFLAFIILALTFIFQSNPGYMDSEFYYLGGRQIIQGSMEIPVIWNYLDNPTNLPNPIFSYWMPFPSIVSALSMILFGPSFFGSRILILILAAGLAPLTYLFSYKITTNRFTSIMAGSMAILSGYYLKFLTIPETILPYMILGILYFYIFARITSGGYEKDVNSKDFLFLGLITGLLHLTRADGFNASVGRKNLLCDGHRMRHDRISLPKSSQLRADPLRVSKRLLEYWSVGVLE